MGYPRFLSLFRLHGGDAPALGWLCALATAVGFTSASAIRLPSVRANLVMPSLLKLLALAVAISAGFFEEAIFRKLLMDGPQHGRHAAVA